MIWKCSSAWSGAAAGLAWTSAGRVWAVAGLCKAACMGKNPLSVVWCSSAPAACASPCGGGSGAGPGARRHYIWCLRAVQDTTCSVERPTRQGSEGARAEASDAAVPRPARARDAAGGTQGASILRKAVSVPAQRALQLRPVEPGAGVLLAPRRDMLVAGDMCYRVAQRNVPAQHGQCPVLGRLEVQALQTFEFDADRVVIALAAPTVGRLSCMPGAPIAVDELLRLAAAGDEKMCGDLQAAQVLVVGMGLRVQPVGDQLLPRRAAELARRQADRVQHDQVDRVAWYRARAMVGRRQSWGEAVPAAFPWAGRIRQGFSRCRHVALEALDRSGRRCSGA